MKEENYRVFQFLWSNHVRRQAMYNNNIRFVRVTIFTAEKQ